MGAFLGELIVSHGSRTRTFERELGAPGVRSRSGLVAFPLAKVDKRLRE